MLLDEFEKVPLLRAMWDHTMEILVLTDSERRILKLNDCALNAFGYDASEIEGESEKVLSLSNRDDEPSVVDANASLQDGVCEFKEVRYVRKDGSAFVGKTKRVQVACGDGDNVCSLTIVYDWQEWVEGGRERPFEQRYLERMCQIAKVGYWRINLTEQTIIWSDVLYDIVGVDKDTFSLVFPESVKVIHPHDYENLMAEIRKAGEETSSFSMEVRMVRPSGEIRYVCVEAEGESSGAGDQVIYVFGSVSDITERVRREEQLFESQKLMDTVLQSIPIRVFWKDLDCRYLGGNRLFAEDAGVGEQSNIPGKTDYDFFGKKSAERFIKDDREVMDTGIAKLFFEESQQREDGSVYWLRTNKIPLKNRNDEIVGVVGTYEDITVLKENERRYALTHYSVDQLKSAVFWSNADGSLAWVNQTACNWLQYGRDEMLTMHVADIYPSFPLDTWEAHWRELKEKKTIHWETFYQRKDGELLPVLRYSNYGVFDGREFEVSFVFDISERRCTEEASRKYQNNLERLVEQRTIELQEINNELESFANLLSHGLRAPLRGIDGFGQALLEDYDSILDENGRRYLRRIRAGVHELSSLIDDLLSLSKVSRSEVILEYVNLNKIVDSLWNDLRSQEPEREVELLMDPGIWVWADVKLLQIAFFNLIGNAWKYSGNVEHAKITVISRIEKENQTIVVSDNGAGFDMRYAQNLFGPFQRLHRADEFEGNGLGLATVKRIIGKHGGSIHAEAELGKGASFFMIIPHRTPE